METAGLRWQPDMCPIAKAIVITVRPKASATPRKPMPRVGKGGGQYRAPASSKDEPESPDKLRTVLFHVILLSVIDSKADVQAIKGTPYVISIPLSMVSP